MAQKIKSIPLMLQAMQIKNAFPDSHISTQKGHSFVWKHDISPSPLGDLYSVKMIYRFGKAPEVYVINPLPLKLPPDANKLEHCYDDEKQMLCLFYPDRSEWNETMLIATTIIPWIYDWLFHYEIWVGTGDWQGGGVHPGKTNKKQ
ncbi:MAG: hypothetical protein L6264_08640 [Weeksellaceae bacterium]|nr:hypothetical protein [Weeksellaceae bacterium]